MRWQAREQHLLGMSPTQPTLACRLSTVPETAAYEEDEYMQDGGTRSFKSEPGSLNGDMPADPRRHRACALL